MRRRFKVTIGRRRMYSVAWADAVSVYASSTTELTPSGFFDISISRLSDSARLGGQFAHLLPRELRFSLSPAICSSRQIHPVFEAYQRYKMHKVTTVVSLQLAVQVTGEEATAAGVDSANAPPSHFAPAILR